MAADTLPSFVNLSRAKFNKLVCIKNLLTSPIADCPWLRGSMHNIKQGCAIISVRCSAGVYTLWQVLTRDNTLASDSSSPWSCSPGPRSVNNWALVPHELVPEIGSPGLIWIALTSSDIAHADTWPLQIRVQKHILSACWTSVVRVVPIVESSLAWHPAWSVSWTWSKPLIICVGSCRHHGSIRRHGSSASQRSYWRHSIVSTHFWIYN